MQPSVELTQDLVRFNTINPPGAERPCAERLASLLEDAGFAVDVIPFGEGRAQLVARIGGAQGKLPLGFTGHLDTVPLGTRAWSVDPLAAEIVDGKLYGRGSSDMKSGVAAFVVSCTTLAEKLIKTPGVVLFITAGEETGCTGAAALAQAKQSLPQVGALVVAEPTGNKLLVGHKGALWLEAVTTGVTAHGSMPEKGINAVYKAARAVTALQDFDFNFARHDVLGSPTLNVGTISGGLNINSVPDRSVIGIDIRTVPGQSHAKIREQLKSYLGDDVALSTLLDAQSVWTRPDDTWIDQISRIVHDVAGFPNEIAAAPYFTDASILTPATGAPPTAIIGPGELALAHQTDEYCFVSRIEEATEIYARMIRNWCGI
ncbi:MAG TPA: M20 family metallopeptidase [Pseudolabrys sp.]|nr:M20 family metallopeptidase [Pseudolabrys sp.]